MQQDWRLNEATDHLRGATLKKMLYGHRKSTASHDHWEFCMALFYDGPTKEKALLQGIPQQMNITGFVKPVIMILKNCMNG